MQATTTMKRFVSNRAGTTAVALSIVIGSVIGITAFAIGDDISTEPAVESARVMPLAYVSAGQGEGLIDAANTRIVAVAPLQAFTSVGQGEGLIDGSNVRAAAAASPRSFIWDGLDESLIDGSTHATVQSYLGLGQGEGLVDPANRIVETSAVNADPSPCHGEGPVRRDRTPDY